LSKGKGWIKIALFDDDDFDKTAKQMLKAAVVLYGLLFLLIGLGIVGILYVIKVWFYGGF
jgi:hypothetical protein